MDGGMPYTLRIYRAQGNPINSIDWQSSHTVAVHLNIKIELDLHETKKRLKINLCNSRK